MKNIAVIKDNLVINIVALENSEDQTEFLSPIYPDSLLMDVTDLDISVGQSWDSELQRFIPINFRENFVFDKSSWSWIPPLPRPEDATWVIDLEPEPEGHSELAQKRVYFWMDKYQVWGMNNCDCIPRPDNDNNWYWNAIEKQWQLPISEMPSPGQYVWDAIEKIWVEITPSEVQ